MITFLLSVTIGYILGYHQREIRNKLADIAEQVSKTLPAKEKRRSVIVEDETEEDKLNRKLQEDIERLNQ